MDKNKLMIAKNAIKKLAERDGVTVEYVRSQMKLAMLHGLSNPDPRIKAFWNSIPHAEAVPTPEEFIIYASEEVIRHIK